MDCALLAVIARYIYMTMRDALRACIKALRSQLADFYQAALIAADMDAHELSVRLLAGNITTMLAYRFKAYTLRAARDLSENISFVIIGATTSARLPTGPQSNTLESTSRAFLPVRYASRSRSSPFLPRCRFSTLRVRLFFLRPTSRSHLSAARSFRFRCKQVAPCRPCARRWSPVAAFSLADVAVLSRARSRSQS